MFCDMLWCKVSTTTERLVMLITLCVFHLITKVFPSASSTTPLIAVHLEVIVQAVNCLQHDKPPDHFSRYDMQILKKLSAVKGSTVVTYFPSVSEVFNQRLTQHATS